jgi:hypothetical protein
MRYNLQAKEIPLKSRDDLIRLGEIPFDPDMIEKAQVGEIDASFAQLLPALRMRQEISDEHVKIILRFIIFSRFRTPTWRRVYYPETYERTQRHLKNFLIKDWNKSQNKKLSTKSQEIINTAFDNILYQMAIVQACNQQIDILSRIDAKVIVLHETGITPFVTCDNPSRPYFPDRIHRIISEPLPGLGREKSQITYPIDPKTCILVTDNPEYPAFAHQELKDGQVRKVNSALALMADKKIIFASPNTDVFEDWLDLTHLKPIRRP